MGWLNCIPFVGTITSAVECAKAVYRGDGKGALWKLGETLIDGALDVSIIATGGLAGIVTAPGKIALSAAASSLGARVLTGVVASSVADDQQSPDTAELRPVETHDDTAGNSSQTHESDHQNSTNAQNSRQQQQSSASSTNYNFSNNYVTQNTDYGSYHGSNGDDDDDKRAKNIRSGCAADLPLSTRQRRSRRLDRLGSIDEQCRPARPRADNVQLANQRIVEHMIDYIESDSNYGLPSEAINFIFETLPRSRALNGFYQLHQNHLVVQVDEVFSGTRGNDAEWEIHFRIDIDGRHDNEEAHVGYTIDRIRNLRGQEPREVGHVYLPSNIEVIGRPPLRLQTTHMKKILVQIDVKENMVRECYVTFLKIDPWND